jgi:hypothetical protein
MLGKAVAFAAAACLSAAGARAQDGDAARAPTAEELLEVAREVWRSPDLRGCPEAKPGEIVVCKPEEEQPRLESPTDEAIRNGEPMPDGIPRAPYVFGLHPCNEWPYCHPMGKDPIPPLIIDLAALPHALTPEEAALVFRAEDLPASTATPEAASPAAAP